ncbi:siphovirus ReqiPepy6 Gp37-like family protein [Desulfuribacillus stibiiarsenatis]|uniref:siphovirus ReqiPepy6 Gp37-like family protein n=1 Tax=Desulfuribacillus stibiiarsenatis TaxID=1390249 RepID=UPI002659D9A2|nr:siphovirus ReqiPepy6 Gp37-like family protein [Desulfuribacillus stibiiarsenatis]
MLAEIEDYTSYMVTRRWSRAGEFQLVINFNKNNVDVLQKGNIIFAGTDFGKAGIIQHVQYSLSPKGKAGEVVVVRGFTLQGLAHRRVVIPNVGQESILFANQPYESIFKGLLNTQIVNPANSNRQIPWVALATNQLRGDSISFSSRYRDLSDELEKLSLLSGMGWEFTLDFTEKKAIFDVYEGIDRTVGSGNPHCIFSTEFDNMKAQSFVDSEFNYANVAIVAGQGEGISREITFVGAGTGTDRYETFVDARDLEDNSKLPQRGQERLNELSGELTLEGEVITKSNVEYEKDYDLGDIVTVRNAKWGVTLNSRITEAIEIYEKDGFKLDLTFGSIRPTFTDAVRKTLLGLNGATYI